MQLLLSSICLGLTSIVIGNAWHQKKQFYPAVVYITKSNASMAVIYIQFFAIVFLLGKLLRKIFLGTLRAAEFERLLERFWYAITETCLAFTVFRDDFNPRFVALFTVLLFLKSFHWLSEERVDFMERSPVLGWLFHIRVASLLTVLGILDYVLLVHAYNSTLVRGPTVQLVFGFEYAILLTVVASTGIKYVLHTAEMRTDTPWENKAVFLLYTELFIGLIKVILYVLFVVIMAKFYALPMFVFRPMFFTIRNFKKALSDVIMSRRAIRNMNTLYPDATPEELRLSDNICIICREDMVNHSKKLPCGHIFHTICLRSWFQRQQTCPTCRLNILRAPATNSTALPRPEENNPNAAAAGAAAPGVNPGAAAAPNAQIPNVGGNDNTAPPGNIFVGSGLPMMQPPLMMPPPPFSFNTPYSLPPPPMPPDLTNFTDEELKALEGNARKNIEERIKLLHNIRLMLDASNILMQNYLIVAASMHTNPTPAAAQPASAAANTPANRAEIPTTSASASGVSSKAATDTTKTEEMPTTSAAALLREATKTKANSAEMPTSPASASSGVSSTAATDTAKTEEMPTTSAAAAAAAAALLRASTTDATVAKHNQVTIEDLGHEEHIDMQPSAASLSSAKTLADNTAEDMNELRKRRLKFLEGQNKTSAE